MLDWFDDDDEDKKLPEQPVAPTNPSVGPALPPDMMADRVKDYITKKYQIAGDDSGIKDAQSKADSQNRIANIGQALEGVFRARSQAYGGQGVNTGIYNTMRSQAESGIKDAKSAREDRLNQVRQENELGRQADSDKRTAVDFDRKTQQFNRDDQTRGREDDPNSEESQSAQALAKKMFPTKDWSGSSATQLKATIPMLEKIYDVDQRAADRRDTLNARREDRQDAKDKRESDYDQAVRIPGLEVNPGFKPTVQGAAKVRDAKTAHDDLAMSLDDLDGIYARSGTNLVGEDSTRQEQIVNSMRTRLKDLERLGALSKGDYDLLDAQLPDPTGVGENLKGFVGQDRYKAKSDEFRKALQRSLKSSAENNGYRVVDQQPADDGKPAPSTSKPKWAK